MAYSTTTIDTYRGTSGVSLPAELSNEIIQAAREQSAVMSLVPQIALPGAGAAIPVILGDPDPAWVGETTEKHVGEPTLVTKTMKPYKLAVIELFSEEFKRDLPALYEALAQRLPGAIAKKFDKTVFFGTAPGSGFDVLSAAPTADISSDVYGGLVDAKGTIAAKGGALTGWAMSPQGETALEAAVGTDGRPLFGNAIDGEIKRILSAPVEKSRAAYDSTSDTVAIAGDWSMARWGIVDGIKIKISEDATVNDGTNQVNLWQRNMFAVMVEAELGFVAADDDYFVLVQK